MVTCFEIHKTLRRQLSQPQRRNRRKIGKIGTVDMRKLDGVLQDLGFASKPHPTIFTENEPDTVFDGLEKFQKANRLTVDGAVKNKDSETGIALNKAMAEFYVPSERMQTLDAKIKKFVIDPKLGKGEQQLGDDESAQEGTDDWKLQEIIRITKEIQETERDIASKERELAGTTDPILRIAIQRLINTLENRLEDLEEELEAVKVK